LKLSIESIRKLFRHSPEDRLLLGQAWAALLLVRLMLGVLPFTTIRAVCVRARRPVNINETPTDVRPHILRVARLVEIAARYSPAGATCLTETLALAWLLGRRGIMTNVRIGVARRNRHVAAHAWLEREGRPIYGLSDGDRYVPLLPAGPDVSR
jgi:hypothetical protein